MESDHQPEVLALDEPALATTAALCRRVWDQNKCLTEAAMRLIATLAVSHVAAHDDEDRHVFDGHLGRRLDAVGGNGGIRGVDDLAVKRLRFVVSSRH